MRELLNEMQRIDIFEEITQKMKEQYFEERTLKHRDRVIKAAAQIVKAYPEFSELTELAKVHDQSKFEEPERTPYIELSWQHKKDNYDGYKTPGTISDEAINKATLHHIKGSSHHPEYWNKDKANISKTNRDNSIECIDASAMPNLAVAEMLADWQAMSQELQKNTAREWFERTKDVRWSYSDEQIELIDKLLKVFEGKVDEAIEKINILSVEGPDEGEYAIEFLVKQNNKDYEYRVDAPQAVIKNFKLQVQHKNYGKAIQLIKPYIPKKDNGQIELFK